LRILSDPVAAESDITNNSAVHRGADWAPLTVITRMPPAATDLSGVDAGLNTGTADVPLGPGQTAVYSFTVSATLGVGRLTATGAAGGSLLTRMTLSDAGGAVLVQPDDGALIQHLAPGTYLLTVSARSGSGAFRLSTAYVQTSGPSVPLAAGAGTCSVAVA